MSEIGNVLKEVEMIGRVVKMNEIKDYLVDWFMVNSDDWFESGEFGMFDMDMVDCCLWELKEKGFLVSCVGMYLNDIGEVGKVYYRLGLMGEVGGMVIE